jgi:threonine dehydrogenase-like Zn-dependent dehydrogenase
MTRTVLYGRRNVRFEQRDARSIIELADAIIRISAICVCGNDLLPYKAMEPSPSRTSTLPV